MEKIFNKKTIIILGGIGLGIFIMKNRKEQEYTIVEPEAVDIEETDNNDEIV